LFLDGREQVILTPVEQAGAAVAEMARGLHLFGFSKGQYGLLDLVEAVLLQVGRAELSLCVPALDARSIERLAGFRGEGLINRCLLALDHAYPGSREGRKLRQAIEEAVGEVMVRVIRHQCRFALLAAGEWRVTILTAMPLTRSARLSHWSLHESRAIYEEARRMLERSFRAVRPGLEPPREEIDAAYRAALGGGVPADVRLADAHEEVLAAQAGEREWAAVRALLDQLSRKDGRG
jgi:hypothetical protein